MADDTTAVRAWFLATAHTYFPRWAAAAWTLTLNAPDPFGGKGLALTTRFHLGGAHG